MKILTPFVLCAVFLVLAYALMRIALFASSMITRRRILSRAGNLTADDTCALIATHIGTSRVITGRSLPIRTPNGTGYIHTDAILLLHGEIVVLEINTAPGRIQNIDEKTWRAVIGRNGELRERTFPSPLEQNDRHIGALISILEKGRITFQSNVSGMVVFVKPKVEFLFHREERICTLAEAIRRLKAKNKKRRFSLKEFLALKRTIRKYTKSTKTVTKKKHR